MKLFPTLLAGVIVLGACRGTSKTPSTIPGSVPVTGSGAPSVAAPVATGKPGPSTTKQPSSVDGQLGFEKAGILARQAKVEALLAPCMREQGFEYTPVDPLAREVALVGGSLSEEDFTKQFGYGITTLYEQRRAQAAGGPNERVRGALSASERQAYDKALLGGSDKDTFALALDNGDFSNLGGCTKKATDAAFGGAGIAESVQGKLDDLDQKIKADGRMRAAIKAWGSCMRQAGNSLGDPDEVDTTLRSRLAKIVGSPPRPDYDRAALTELQRFEVALVTEDNRCEKQHITPVETTVRAEAEKAFREQNADLLAKVPAP